LPLEDYSIILFLKALICAFYVATKKAELKNYRQLGPDN